MCERTGHFIYSFLIRVFLQTFPKTLSMLGFLNFFCFLNLNNLSFNLIFPKIFFEGPWNLREKKNQRWGECHMVGIHLHCPYKPGSFPVLCSCRY